MSETQVIQKKLNQLSESINVLTDNLHSTLSYTDERLKSIEKLMWKINKKLVDQDKILNLLTKNELIDELVTRKYYKDRIKPYHLQSETYRKQTAEAIMYEDD